MCTLSRKCLGYGTLGNCAALALVLNKECYNVGKMDDDKPVGGSTRSGGVWKYLHYDGERYRIAMNCSVAGLKYLLRIIESGHELASVPGPQDGLILDIKDPALRPQRPAGYFVYEHP